jgi:hypothetical protein
MADAGAPMAAERPLGPSDDRTGVAPAAPRGARPARVAARGLESRAHAATDEAGAVASDGPAMARKFVGRVAQLHLEGVRAAVETWRDLMRDEAGAWFAAEEVVARAVVVSGRRGVQKELLLHVAEAFAHAVWYGGRADAAPPETRVRATEASGQYLATLAMLALLVRDRLDAGTFDVVYRPFAALVPLSDLGRE